MITDIPVPSLDDVGAEFWERARNDELVVQRCGSCRRLRFPPREACPSCRSFAYTWEPVSGRGHVWSFVIAHPPLLPAFERLAPYNVVVVTLVEDENVRLVGNLVGDDVGDIGAVDPSSLRIGEPVTAVFDHTTASVPLLRWRRAA
jgi:uncharacterized OB-fold protein